MADYRHTRSLISAAALAVAEARAINPTDAVAEIRKIATGKRPKPVPTIGTLSAGATKAQRQAHHKLKMDLKKRRRGA